MDTELKQKWIDALRGGSYKQIRGSLHDGYGYCCLGVLCDLVDSSWTPIGRTHHHSCGDETGEMLSRSFRENIGLSKDLHDNLIQLNDEDKYSFGEIVHFIKKNL